MIASVWWCSQWSCLGCASVAARSGWTIMSPEIHTIARAPSAPATDRRVTWVPSGASSPASRRTRRSSRSARWNPTTVAPSTGGESRSRHPASLRIADASTNASTLGVARAAASSAATSASSARSSASRRSAGIRNNVRDSTRNVESLSGSRLRTAGAISWIKEHYAEPLQVEALAKRVNMSASALHSHFRAVAGVSPTQYQKDLRLQEARRLLLSGATSAEAVAYEVGYASASQFSRECGRLFGQPPRRDAERMRELTPVRP